MVFVSLKLQIYSKTPPTGNDEKKLTSFRIMYKYQEQTRKTVLASDAS